MARLRLEVGPSHTQELYRDGEWEREDARPTQIASGLQRVPYEHFDGQRSDFPYDVVAE